MFFSQSAIDAARLGAELEATRARLADRDAEIVHLRARVTHLETLLDQRSVDVLNTVLSRQGFTAVGEEGEVTREPAAFGAHWGETDWRMYENWERDFLIACPGKTKEEAQRLYMSEYGAQMPRLALL